MQAHLYQGDGSSHPQPCAGHTELPIPTAGKLTMSQLESHTLTKNGILIHSDAPMEALVTEAKFQLTFP